MFDDLLSRRDPQSIEHDLEYAVYNLIMHATYWCGVETLSVTAAFQHVVERGTKQRLIDYHTTTYHIDMTLIPLQLDV
ncbi:hypothetical protein CHU98_g325 [Xylaria longipes]|nr:hypothetical protein CHU98_g325 [Xylaria longipes]